MVRRSSRKVQWRPSAPLLAAMIGLLVLVSLATVLRVYAIPIEARTVEAWYSYKSSVGFDFVANVTESKFYSDTTIKPDLLAKQRLPVDPPQYRRVLISRFADSVDVSVPYRFQGDRDAELRANMRVDGLLVVPGVWEKPYPLVTRREIKVQGREVAGILTFSIPVKALWADIKATRESTGIALEPLELIIRPVFLVEVGGLKEPVGVLNNPEFKVSIRTATTEIDDPREALQEKKLETTRVLPITLSILGNDVAVAALRKISMVILVLSLGGAGLLLWQRRRRRSNQAGLLARLGSGLVQAESFQIPPDTAIVELRTVQELVHLHHQTERPIIQVNTTCYLVDGTTCYRLRMAPPEPVRDGPAPEERLRRLAGSVSAQPITLDPWITEVRIGSAADMLQLHDRLGRTLIRTKDAYHLIDGNVCFTYKETLSEVAAAQQQ